MNYSYDEIVAEIKVFSRNYSRCHSVLSKWRSYKTKISGAPDHAISVHEIDGKLYALIYRPMLECIEAFQFDVFAKRILIKRNEILFREVKSLWKLLNPFHLAGISKQVYAKFYEFIHFHVLDSNSPTEDSEKVVKNDLEIDFRSAKVQNFADFYDSLFENIDLYTKSTLVNEYCRVLKRVISEVKHSNWIKNTDLHSKLHTEGIKPLFPQWATLHLRVKSNDFQLGQMRNTFQTVHLPMRLLSTTAKKPQKSQMRNTKYENMVSPWNEREKPRPKILKKVPELISADPAHSTKAEVANPIIKKLKPFKDKKLIEQIIHSQLEKTVNIKERILHTPIPYL